MVLEYFIHYFAGNLVVVHYGDLQQIANRLFMSAPSHPPHLRLACSCHPRLQRG